MAEVVHIHLGLLPSTICTWAVARPHRGFCPGTGCADLAFTLVFQLYVSSLQDKLRAEGIGLKLHCPEPVFHTIGDSALVESLDVTWVDDTVICAACHSTADIVPIAKRIASIAFSDLRRFGFTPNTKRGKTQVMPIILGPDTPAVASKIYVEDKSEMKVRDLHGNDYTICVGMSYKHLGSYKDSKRNKAQELSYRAGEASSAAKELFRATRKAEVTPPKNWQLALSLCASRLCYDAHTDSFFTEAQMKNMSSTYDGLARRSVSRKFFHESSRCSAAFARALCVAAPAELHLRFARLSYLARLIDTGPLFVLAAIDVLARSPRSFFRLVLDDLQWLFEHRGAEFGMPDPREEVRDTLDWIGAQTVRWRN